jgi:hypothetical protein
LAAYWAGLQNIRLAPQEITHQVQQLQQHQQERFAVNDLMLSQWMQWVIQQRHQKHKQHQAQRKLLLKVLWEP